MCVRCGNVDGWTDKQQHAHKISIIYDEQGVGYLYYTAVGPKGRGIALLTSKPVQ